MSDRFSSSDPIDGSGRDFFVITPANSDLATRTRAIYVGGGGNISVRGIDSTIDVVFFNVPPGTILPLRARRVNSTGTTATNIVGIT